MQSQRVKSKLSYRVQIVAVQSLSHVQLFATPWTAACQASLSFTNSQNLLKLMSIESVMPSSHLILCCPLLLPPSIFPSIRVFSNESALYIRWPKYWSFIPKPTPTYSPKGLHRTPTALQRMLEIQHQNNDHHNEVGSIPKT